MDGYHHATVARHGDISHYRCYEFTTDPVMDAQKELLDLRDRIVGGKVKQQTVISVDGKIKALETIEKRMKRLEADMDSAWMAMDELANPLGR